MEQAPGQVDAWGKRGEGDNTRVDMGQGDNSKGMGEAAAEVHFVVHNVKGQWLWCQWSSRDLGLLGAVLLRCGALVTAKN